MTRGTNSSLRSTGSVFAVALARNSFGIAEKPFSSMMWSEVFRRRRCTEVGIWDARS
jgi:hypothetical protein